MSDIATKLITVADNTLAVADAVNAAKATASGSVVRVDDVLNVEHPLSVQLSSKNLIDFVGLLGEGYTNELNGLSCHIENGCAVITGTHTIAGYSNIMQADRFTDNASGPVIILPAGTYTTPNKLTIQLNNLSTGKNTNYGNTFTLTEPHRLATFYVSYRGEGTTVDAKIPLVMVAGTTDPTEYTPYTTDFSGVNVSKYGKNLAILSRLETRPGQSYVLYHADGSITVDGKQSGTTGLDTGLTLRQFAPGMIPGKTYMLQGNSAIANRNCIYMAAPYAKSWRFGTSLTVTDEILDCRLYFYTNNGEINTITNFQIELGANATDYEQFKEPQTATSDSSGKVTGLTSASPSMTIVPNSDAVTVECTYFPQAAADTYAKYQELKSEQMALQEKLQEYLQEESTNE